MENNLIALFLLLISAFMNSLLTVLIEFLENNGATWVQTFCFAEWVDIILLMIFWVVLFGYNYYICKSDESEKYGNFLRYLFSIFPSLKWETQSVKQWSTLIGRSFFGILTYACYNISMLYCDSGNVILIETVITSLGNLVLGWMLFGEKLNWIIYMSLFVCIAGLVLVTQPSFLFGGISDDDDNYRPISGIGFAFMLIAGLGRAGYNALIKKTQYLGISNMTAMLVPEMMAGFFIGIMYIIGNAYWDWQFINNVNDNDNLTFVLVSLGILLFVWVMTATVGFRLGEMGRLGIINNSDIVMTYLLQIGILRETDGYLCYVGAGLVCLGCIIIFWEQSRGGAESTSGGGGGISSIGGRSDSIGFGNNSGGDAKNDAGFAYVPITGGDDTTDGETNLITVV